MQTLIRANLALILVGVLTFVMMGVGQAIFGPALPAFQRNLDLSQAEAGFLISALWIGCAFGVAAMYLKGPLLGPRPAVGLMAAGAAVMTLGPGYFGTLAGALIFGAGYGCSTVVFNPRMLRAFGARGPAMLSLLNATYAAGAIAAPLVFVALGSNPTISFAVVTLLAVICLLGTAFVRDEAATPVRIAGPFNPRVGLMTFAAVGIGIEAALIGLGPTALIATGVAEDVAARLLSLFFVAFLASRVGLIFVAHRVAPFTLYLVAITGTAGFALAAALLSAPVFFVAMGACAGLFFPGFYVAAARVMGNDPRVTPTIIAAGLAGGISSPVLLSSVMDRLGDHGFFWIIAGVAALTTIAAFVLGRPAMRG